MKGNSFTQYLLCVAGFFCWSVSTAMAQHRLCIQLSAIPESHTADSIFVAGSFNGWQPGNATFCFQKNKAGVFEMVLPSLAPGHYEFKFTRGSWSKVACASSGNDMGNYHIELHSDTTLTYSVAAWKDDFKQKPQVHSASPNVAVMDSAFYLPQLNRYRRIWVYLPPDYHKTKNRYPVLYMHDGQNLFDAAASGFGEWGVDECLDSLAVKRAFQYIVVGIDNGPKRLNEYNPYNNQRFGPGEGEAYATFIANTLKPYIDSAYRTLKDKNNTVIAGSSMGGLISYYAALRYPQVFGKAGVFSPAFWTAKPQIFSFTDSVAAGNSGKFFFYMGGHEGEEYMQDMIDVLTGLGTRSSALIYTAVDTNGAHNETTWRKWLPEFIKFMSADWTNYIINARVDE